MVLGESNAPIIQEFLIYGANTDVGKTVVSAALCHFAATLGRPVTYVKPVQTGEDTDAAALKRHVPEGQLKTETRPKSNPLIMDDYGCGIIFYIIMSPFDNICYALLCTCIIT